MIHDGGVAAFVHIVFECAGIATGAALYRKGQRAAGGPGLTAPGRFAVLVGLLTGAALGNKLAFLAERPDVWHGWLQGRFAWPGQSIVGGLVGGLVGVEVAKAWTHQTVSTGDAMVWPVAIGIAIGRVGCFAAGLHDDTYGLATSWPWGLDFGDGVPRHPTQLYDMAMVALLAWAVNGRFARVPGLAFKLFLSGYLAWRLLIDGFKPVPHAYAGGLSGIQWLCAVVLACYAPVVWRALSAWRVKR
jgi:prolipoprotein diacylglyceryltransferase